ncbi:MAG: hypothetical protein GWP09_00015 [Nitrospiraceae bacterium]|nr:hypothetical protein [Nitrospiraceae bacterium]
MFELLTNPFHAIERSKKRSIGSILLWLIFPAVIIPLSFWLIDFKVSGLELLWFGSVIYVMTLFLAFLVDIFLKVYKKKAKYGAALESFTNAFFVLSWWVLLYAVLDLISKNYFYHAIMKIFILGITLVLVSAVLIKSFMKLYDIDLLTTIVVLGIVFFVLLSFVPSVITMLGNYMPNVLNKIASFWLSAPKCLNNLKGM